MPRSAPDRLADEQASQWSTRESHGRQPARLRPRPRYRPPHHALRRTWRGLELLLPRRHRLRSQPLTTRCPGPAEVILGRGSSADAQRRPGYRQGHSQGASDDAQCDPGAQPGRARLLGAPRLAQLRRSLARAAILGRLMEGAMTGSNLYRTRPEPGGEMDQAQARALLAGEGARLLRLHSFNRRTAGGRAGRSRRLLSSMTANIV
jgi:hypothetical protein